MLLPSNRVKLAAAIIVSIRINTGSRNALFSAVTPGYTVEVEAIPTVIVAVDAQSHTAIKGCVVVVVVTLDIMKSHYNIGISST